ncbi:MAG: hypothetical protein JWO38_2188 [Gemmataceae bacterium]|nr:hypothetical protein [Gemmataceae bacterium]
MPKTKTPTRTDEDVVEPLPADPVETGPADNGYVLDMGGKGAEVASALIVNGLLPFLSVTNKGINLVTANRAATAFVPVKITSRADWPTLDLKRDDAAKLEAAGAVLAFLVGEDDDRASWYLTVAEFLSRAEARGEGTLSIRIDEHWEWLEPFEGHPGIRRAFKHLLT